MIIDMANGAVTGLVLKDVPDDPPKLDSCPSCALTKAQRLPSKTRCPRIGTRPRRPARPMPVESISRCKYGFIPVDGDSLDTALRAKPDAPVEFEK